MYVCIYIISYKYSYLRFRVFGKYKMLWRIRLFGDKRRVVWHDQTNQRTTFRAKCYKYAVYFNNKRKA